MSEESKAVTVDSSVEQSSVKKGWKAYFAFLKDRKFWKILLLGQLLSLCITGTNVVNTKLTNEYNFSASTTQSFLVYACLAIIYNSYAIYKRGIKGWLLQFWRRGIFYFILGFIDVEGNYFVNKSFQYTSLLSAELIDCWSTPVCMILSFIFLKVRYRWVQYLGVFICLCGLGMLVGSDVMTDKNYGAVDAVKGDLFCLLGATLYGLSNVGEEIMARKHPLYEVIGMFSFFATLINLVQIFIFERDQWSQFGNPGIAGMIVTYTICMLVLYSFAPVIFRMGSAVVYNISLLTSDFYGLIFGLGLFGYKVTILYPFAYVVVIVGILIYHVFPTPVPAIGNFDAEKAAQEAKELHGNKQEDLEAPHTEVISSKEEISELKN
ncbi:solute carrier family 35 member SLC35F1/F2/F6 [Choanephora cucurbitarum]|nr:solute carrier family 35 member SLC35F1/F2/F6 [Choanephora cucurbitarum]